MDDHTVELPKGGSPRGRSAHNPESADVTSQTAFEWEKLRLERQKYALEVRLKRRELQERNRITIWKDLLTNPVTIAIVGGIITLLTAVITTYFNARESRQAESAKARLAEESTKQTLQSDLIKKFVESPRTETVRENLRFLVDAGLVPTYAESIKKYLDSNPGVAPQVGGGIEFAPSGVSVADEIKGQLQKTVDRFAIYLRNLGFSGLDKNVSVFVYSRQNPPPIPGQDSINAFYANNTIYVHEKLIGDTSMVLREYVHHALLDPLANQNRVDFAEVESALADYLPASFLDSPLIGAGLGAVLGLKTDFVRTLDSAVSYERSPYAIQRGVVWAAALWACRLRVGQQAVDSLILSAWRQATAVRGINQVAEEFGKALMASKPPVGPCFSTEIDNRKLP
jgi:hypothetical protein